MYEAFLKHGNINAKINTIVILYSKYFITEIKNKSNTSQFYFWMSMKKS